MFKKATKLAYAKVGIYGDAGSGKTVTASKLAIGLHKKIGSTKPIVFFDTEPAASFVEPLFDQAGIELLVADESRALKDLMEFMKKAPEIADICIVDSVSHVWRDVQESYLKNINDRRKKMAESKGWKFKPINQIEFQDWRHIKNAWGEFTTSYLTSKIHCFVLGRAGTIYEYQENREGKKELITTGTKMATEKELAYEPSSLIEMMKVVGEQKALINRAMVEKDRNVANPLTGWQFDFPEFENFAQHFDFYDIGGKHIADMGEKNSTELFGETGEDGFTFEKRQREIECEEIKSLFMENSLDGTAAAVKKERNQILKKFFGTGSWTKVESMNSSELKRIRKELSDYLESQGE